MMLYVFLKVFPKSIPEIFTIDLPTLHLNNMIISMQGVVIDIIINMVHDMISAHILHVATFTGYNRMLNVLKIGTVYVTF